MRGLWDNEQTLTPSLLKSGMALLGGLLFLLAAANVTSGVFYVLDGRWLPAATQIAGGLAIPLGIWLAVKILADFLTVQHRMNDRIQEMADQTSGVAREAHAQPVWPADDASPDLSMAETV
jgi:hypothetical protein